MLGDTFTALPIPFTVCVGTGTSKVFGVADNFADFLNYAIKFLVSKPIFTHLWPPDACNPDG